MPLANLALLRRLLVVVCLGMGFALVAQPASAEWRAATSTKEVLTPGMTGCTQHPYDPRWYCPNAELACRVVMTNWWAYATWPDNLLSVEINPGGGIACVVRPYCCMSSGTRYYGTATPICPAGQDTSPTATSGCRAPAWERLAGYFCRTSVGNPINTANGNKYTSVVDFASEGPNSLEFTRYYNSGKSLYESRNDMMRTSLGVNWASNYHRVLEKVNFFNNLFYRSESGRLSRFTGAGAPMDPDDPTRLVINGTTSYTVTDENGRIETFGYNPRRLLSIQERNGYLRTLTWGTDGQLASVSDSHGRTLTFTYDQSNNSETTVKPLISVTLPDSRVIKYVYDRALTISTQIGTPDRLIEVIYPDDTPATDADNPRVQYLYEDAAFPFALTGILDENGIRVATYTYDSLGRGTLSEHAGGADRVTVAYDVAGANTRTVTDPLGRVSIFRFTTLQSVPKLTQIDGQATPNCPAATHQLTYDTNGYVASSRDWNNNLTTYVRDTLGRETTRTEASGTSQARTVTTTWHATHRLPTQIVEPRRTIDFTYDTNGRLLTRTETDTTTQSVPYSTNGRTRTWTFTWSTTGQLLTADGPRTDVSDVTTFAYTTDGYLQSVTNALSQVTQVISQDGAGRPLTVRDENGIDTTLTYDPRGRLLTRTVTTGGSATTTLTYTPTGLVSRITLPDSSYLDYTYDDAHRLTRVTSSNGDRIDYTLDADGNATQEVVRNAGSTITRTQSRVFDEMSRLIRDVGAASQITAYGYDKNSNLTSATDPLTHATAFAFDALNRLITVTNAASGQTQQAWDGQDNQTDFTDPGSVSTGFVYDGFGQVIQEASPDGGTIVYERDVAGNITRVTDGRGVVTDLTYDALNRPLTRSYASAPAQNVTYTYDAAGAVYGIGRLTGWSDASGSTSVVYDARGNVTQSTRVIGGHSYVTQYSWTLADLPESVTYPTGRIVSYTRDTLGRVTAISQKDNAAAPVRTVADNITWQPFGSLAGLRHANTVDVGFTYDLDGRLTRILATGGSTTFLDLNYTWDDADNITAIADARLPALDQSFGYDTLDRLTSATGAYGSWTYGYSANSNRTSRSQAGGLSETYTLTSGSNRLASVSDGTTTRALGYDGAGNITSDNRSPSQTFTYIYDQAGRLTEVQLASQTWTRYELNALGERVAKIIPGTPDQVTHFHYDLDGRLIAETDAAGNMLREYIWLEELPVMYRSGTAEYAILTDHLATPSRLVDVAGGVVWDAVWRPFGELHSLTASVAFPLRLPGQYFDAETGLHYNYQRDYDPALGRYIQSDPLGLIGGFNRYGYGEGNPNTWIDPRGERGGLGLLGVVLSRVALIFARAAAVAGAVDTAHGVLCGNIDIRDAAMMFALGRLRPIKSLLGLAGAGRKLGMGAKNVANASMADKMARVRKLGSEGEAYVRARVRIGETGTIKVNGKNYRPDGLTRATLSEVKNVKSLKYTQQLRAFEQYASEKGLQFDLYVRKGTEISPSLLRAQDLGRVNIIPFLP